MPIVATLPEAFEVLRAAQAEADMARAVGTG